MRREIPFSHWSILDFKVLQEFKIISIFVFSIVLVV